MKPIDEAVSDELAKSVALQLLFDSATKLGEYPNKTKFK
jgi:hypothetical protein